LTFPYQGEERTETLESLFERTGTQAFLVVMDDHLVYESYPGTRREDIHTSFSVAKSFVSGLIGAAIADGVIRSVEEPMVSFIPELAGRGLDGVTLHNLMRMDSGIRYRSEAEVLAPFSDDALTYYPPDLRAVALSVQPGEMAVGEAFLYNNFHPLLEGLIIERATGMNVAEYLQERIWKPMGAVFSASWSMDSAASGFEKMESGINARAVDFARYGLLYLHGGSWNGRQILPAEWVAASTRPDPTDARSFLSAPDWQEQGGYYGYHWWGMALPDGAYDFMARGNLGQIIYVAPRKNMVVVRLGAEGDPAVSWPLVVRVLVDNVE
jgi:CubicO group peptidase (beta-lactamase class C family)